MSKLSVGVDLGGTKILALAMDSDNNVLGRAKTPTQIELGMEGIALQMRETAESALNKAEGTWDDVAEIGIAVPTSVDPNTGDVLHAPALGWKNQPARQCFRDVFEKEIYLENDVNCGILAEFRSGAAKGTQTAVGYFVGTGLGGGIIIDGKLRRGPRGVAGELGHEIVCHGGKRCGCGHRGCVEAYASKTAFCREFSRLINKKGRKSCLTKMVGKDFTNVRSKVLSKAYRGGDKVVCRVLNKGARVLGVATANMYAVLSPDCVVLGGGVMEALGEELMPYVWKGLRKHIFGIGADEVVLKLSELGDNAVPLGAAFVARAQGDV